MFHYSPSAEEPGPYPYIVPGDRLIRGEALTFSDFRRAVEILDRIEDCPRLFVRRTVTVTYPDGGTEPAQVYFIHPGEESPGPEVEDGDWLEEMRRIKADS